MSRYNFDVNKIKERLKKTRNDKGYTQINIAEGLHISTAGSRSAIATWESTKKETLPPIDRFIDLCNILDVDINYLLGAVEYKSLDTKMISDTINVSEDNIIFLKNNSQYGKYIDALINHKIGDYEIINEVLKRIHQLSRNSILQDVVITSLKRNFANDIQNQFDKFYQGVFPMDMSAKTFEKYLFDNIPYNKDFSVSKFIEENFKEDGEKIILNNFFPLEEETSKKITEGIKDEHSANLQKNQEEIYKKNIQKQYELFYKSEEQEQYKMIISSIVDICYDYFMSEKIVELSKRRIIEMISSMVDDIIEKEANSIKEKVKKCVINNNN